MPPQICTIQGHKGTLLACFCLLFWRRLSSFPLFFFPQRWTIVVLDIHLAVRTLQCFHLCYCWSFMFQDDMRLYSFCVKRLEIARVTRKAFFSFRCSALMWFSRWIICVASNPHSVQHSTSEALALGPWTNLMWLFKKFLFFVSYLQDLQAKKDFLLTFLCLLWSMFDIQSEQSNFWDFTEFKSLCCDLMWYMTLFS